MIGLDDRILMRSIIAVDPPVFEGITAINNVGAYSTSIDVDFPTTVNAGDILLCILVRDAPAYNFYGQTPPSGFSEITRNFYPSTILFWKRATGSESGSVTIAIDSENDETYGYMARISGVSNTFTPTATSSYGGLSSYFRHTYYASSNSSILLLGFAQVEEGSNINEQYNTYYTKAFGQYAHDSSFALFYRTMETPETHYWRCSFSTAQYNYMFLEMIP